MGYCILRVAKIKSRVSLLRTAQHNTRERMPDNANPQMSPRNMGGRNTEQIMQAYTDLLPEKVRKNAVHAVEFVLTLSPDSWKGLGLTHKQKLDKAIKYCYDACAWAQKELGGKQNCLSAIVHVDEGVPHYHVLMMPLKDGKLNAKYYIGGHRDRLKKMQTDFYEKVGKKHDLERGLPREQTHSRHQDLRTYYSKLDQVIQQDRARETVLRTAAETRLKAIDDLDLGGR